MAKTRILIVCQWPLGGIRTYLKYNYRYFPRERFEITILANPAIESDALVRDMQQLGIKVVWAEPLAGRNVLFWRLRQLRRREHFDLVHSQGFISAVHTALANRRPHTPHIMTIHGVLEKKRFAGRFGRLKKRLFERLMRRVDVLIGVGEDIGQHVRAELTALNDREARWVTIRNGIDPAPFIIDYPDSRSELRRSLELSGDTFIFGYFGRFMPEKGFNFVIDAVGEMLRTNAVSRPFVVMAVGSGDYETKYKAEVTNRGLDNHFRFRPFERDVAPLIQACDTILMPSLWEAYGLLAAESLTAGSPLIASACPGLREAVADTPAIQIPAGDSAALAHAMTDAISDSDLRTRFQRFRTEAARRYDVRSSAEQLIELVDRLVAENH